MLHSPVNAPSVRGNLSATSIPELLVLALDRKLRGSVVIKTPAQTKSALYLDAGRVTKVRTAEPIEPLGHLLMASGAIDRGMLDRALSHAEQQRSRLGASLLELGALPPSLLDSMLEEQLSRRVTWVGALPPESIFGYYADLDVLADRPACPADPLAVIWRSVRDAALDHPHQEALLSELGREPLRLHPAAAPERLQLSPDERAFVLGLRACPLTLSDALSSHRRHVSLAVSRARRLIYVLALTRQLDMGRHRSPVEAARPAPSAPPAPRAVSATSSTQPALPAARAASVTRPSMPAARAASVTRPSMPAARAASLMEPPTAAARKPSNPPLCAGPSATPTAITQRSMPAVSAPLPARPSVAALPAQSSTAAASAAAGAPPTEPSTVRPAPGRSQPAADPERASAAARAFFAAQAWVARKRFDRAEELARQACDADPHKAEYLALHAWLRMQCGELAQPLRAAQIVAQLDRAVSKDRDSVSARFYRGQVLKRLGREEDAYKDFRFVARRKPDHIDAVREVRLHEMRARNALKRAGVLSRLFLR